MANVGCATQKKMSEILVDQTSEKVKHPLTLRAQSDPRTHNLLDLEEQLPIHSSLDVKVGCANICKEETQDLDNEREKRQLCSKKTSAANDFVRSTKKDGDSNDEFKERSVVEMATTILRMTDENLKKKLTTNKNCCQVSDQASPTTPRCFAKLLFFTDLHSKVVKNEKMSVPPKVLKQLRDVQMDVQISSLFTNDSDSDNETRESEIRDAFSKVHFENSQSPDSLRLVSQLISQPSQSLSQLTQSQQSQSQSQSPRHRHEDQRKCGHQKTLSHKGPFKKKDKDDPSHRNCMHSVLVEWDDGTQSWEPLNGDVMKNADMIAACIVEKDLFELTEQSRMWGVNNVKNEIKKNCPECAKEKCSPKRKRKAQLTLSVTSDDTSGKQKRSKRRCKQKAPKRQSRKQSKRRKWT